MAGETDVFVLAARNSDHYPIFLTYGVQLVEPACSNALFKFVASWMVNDACLGVVDTAWRRRECVGDPLDILCSNFISANAC